MKPNYDLRCAEFCTDQRGRYRTGSEWVYLFGRTQWVCGPCANRLARAAGIPTQAQVHAAMHKRMARMQMRLDLATETHSVHQAQGG